MQLFSQERNDQHQTALVALNLIPAQKQKPETNP